MNRWTLLAFGVLLTASLPATAWAQCTSDVDCMEGQVCVFAPCPMIDCAPNSSCPEPACDTTGECVAAGGSGDVWWGNECATDGDCPTGFTCEETGLACETYGCGCACPACDPAAGSCPPCECDCPAPPPCEQTLISVCAYSPQQCASDADCEAGFECVADEICYGTACACPGTDCVCAECPPGETCPPCECPEPTPCDCPTDPVETCETVGSYCLPKPITCTTAADCPADWECAEILSGGSDCFCAACECMDPAACPPDDTACIEATTNCACPPCECTTDPALTVSYCMPAGWDDLVGTAPTSSGEARNESSPAAEFLDHAQDTTGGGTTNPPSSNDGKDSGCAVAVPGRSDDRGLLILLPLLGLLFVARRRR